MSLDSADANNLRAPDSIDITLSPLSDSTWLSPGGSTASTSFPPDFLPGFQIVRELHRGGQGIVFLAMQKSMQREVAIKVMKEGPFADATDRARFDREVHILAKLKHPNIVTIHDSGRIAGCDYFVMDYVAGMSLDEFVEQTKPSLRALLELFRCICETVEVAHVRNIIHRDLKPGNIRVDTEGRPRILDFGLAKVVGAPRASNATEQGMFVGSIPWASPEQARGELETLDPRTDVYSLGVILYQLLTNRFPYEVVGPPHEVLSRIICSQPVPPRSLRKDIDRDLNTIVLKCLAKTRDRRYSSSGEVAEDIGCLLQGRPIQAKHDSLAYVVGTHARRLTSRHRIVRSLAVIIAVTCLVKTIGFPLVFSWTPLHGILERFLARSWAPASVARGMDGVCVVALTDETDFVQLAESAGLVGVTRENKKSLRRLHGCLMAKLRDVGCRAVVWDIKFASRSEFDDDFVRGARALRESNVDVVVGLEKWWMDDSASALISPVLAPEVRWGCIVAGLGPKLPWRVQLIAQRGLEDPLPSLALSAYASARAPGKQFDMHFDVVNDCLDLTYWTPDPIVRQHKRQVGPSDHIELGLARQGDAAKNAFAPSTGLRLGDSVGIYLADAPPDPILRAATLAYHDVFSANPDQLRTWLSGKVVLLADFRDLADRSKTTDGRLLPRPYVHAAAISSLLSHASIRMPRGVDEWAIPLLAATAGTLIVTMLRRTAVRTLVLAGLTMVIFITSLFAYRANRYLIDAIVPIFALWLSACGCLALRRFAESRTQSAILETHS